MISEIQHRPIRDVFYETESEGMVVSIHHIRNLKFLNDEVKKIKT
jgi:hypothetical protein